MPRSIQAVTFDLWDTLVIDDSDEAKRSAQGLAPKAEARPRVIYDAVRQVNDVPYETVELAWKTATAAFNHVWHEMHVTWTVAERLSVVLGGLGVTLPADLHDAVVLALEEMELDIPPDLVPGVHEALAALKGRYKLAVVSDAIVCSGKALRRMLENHGLAEYFDVFVFSDEAGASKPDPKVFCAVAEGLGVDLKTLVHIGDRDHNDVKGPHAVGARAILFTAARDADKDNTTADAVCDSFATLPAILEQLERS